MFCSIAVPIVSQALRPGTFLSFHGCQSRGCRTERFHHWLWPMDSEAFSNGFPTAFGSGTHVLFIQLSMFMLMRWRFKHPMSRSGQANGSGHLLHGNQIKRFGKNTTAGQLSHSSEFHGMLSKPGLVGHPAMNFLILTHTHARATSPLSFRFLVHRTSHAALSHTTLSHTSPSHETLSHTTLSQTTLSQTTLTHTQLFRIQLWHTELFHTPRFHTNLSNTSLWLFWTYQSSTTSFVFPPFPVPLQLLFLIIGRSWLAGLSGPLNLLFFAWGYFLSFGARWPHFAAQFYHGLDQTFLCYTFSFLFLAHYLMGDEVVFCHLLGVGPCGNMQCWGNLARSVYRFH